MEISKVLTQKSIARGETSFEEVAWVKVGKQSDTPYIQIHSYRRNYTLYGQQKEHENFAYIEISNWRMVQEILSCIEFRTDSDRKSSYSIEIIDTAGVYKKGEDPDTPIGEVEFCIEELYATFQLWDNNDSYLGCVEVPIPEKVEDAEVEEENLLEEFEGMIKDLTKLEPSQTQSQTVTSEHEEYNVFLSHSSEDKEKIARPLYKELRDRGHDVWFDESAMEKGDILTREIDQGLTKSDFGIVLLSPDFFDSNWTETELYALLTSHIKGSFLLIPVRHQMTIDDIESQSRILASLLVSNTDGRSISDVVDEIEEAMNQ